METDDTVAQEASSDTLLASSTLLARVAPESPGYRTDLELSRVADPGVALLDEEQRRTQRVAPLMCSLGLLAVISLPLFGGTPWAKTLLYTTLLAGITTMGWLWWLARQSRPLHRWSSTFAWSTAFTATCANTIYFGVYSPAPVLMTLAVVVFAQGQSLVLARGAYLCAAATQGAIPLLDGLGILKDPGIVDASSLATIDRVAGQLLVQSLLVGAYRVGRAARVASAEAISRVHQAVRELARREVIAREAREGFRRALNIGGAGRLSGSVYGNYRLAEVIGHGGMGEVYRGKHTSLDTPAAIKVIHPHLCQDEQILQRFLREAQLSASLDTPYIVRVLDAGNPPPGPFIAMELLQGYDLATHLQSRGPLSLDELQTLASQVGQGLDVAAKANIVHRDIKPQNLFLVEGDTLHCKILDFGIARAMSGQATLTQGSAVLGTPAYMAPEQAVGREVDHRSDLHALTSVLYRAATGFVPFTGDSAHAILFSVVNHMPEKASERANVSRSLDAFFEKGFAKNPDERYQSGKELAEALSLACSENS